MTWPNVLMGHLWMLWTRNCSGQVGEGQGRKYYDDWNRRWCWLRLGKYRWNKGVGLCIYFKYNADRDIMMKRWIVRGIEDVFWYLAGPHKRWYCHHVRWKTFYATVLLLGVFGRHSWVSVGQIYKCEIWKKSVSLSCQFVIPEHID